MYNPLAAKLLTACGLIFMMCCLVFEVYYEGDMDRGVKNRFLAIVNNLSLAGIYVLSIINAYYLMIGG